jgi:thiamine-monophosphate kinase
MKERKLIDRIRRLALASGDRAVVHGIGDDCAVLRLPAASQLLVTTDLYVENVHFRRPWHPADSVGHKCLARGLSDIAAMGGKPLACFVSLGLPPNVSQKWIDGFLRGLLRLARRCNVQLAGGDLSSAQQIVADIVVTGEVPSGSAVLRSGARPGHRIYVTGSLGGSAAVLNQLFAGQRVKPSKASPHFYPQPRLAAGRWLQQRGLATAMIDLSDGLSVDLAHICEESHVAARISATELPVARRSSLELALHGGEDYELLFTAPKRAKVPGRIAGVPVTEIGVIQKPSNYSPAIQILGDNGKVRPLAQRGWEHFKQ